MSENSDIEDLLSGSSSDETEETDEQSSEEPGQSEEAEETSKEKSSDEEESSSQEGERETPEEEQESLEDILSNGSQEEEVEEQSDDAEPSQDEQLRKELRSLRNEISSLKEGRQEESEQPEIESKQSFEIFDEEDFNSEDLDAKTLNNVFSQLYSTLHEQLVQQVPKIAEKTFTERQQVSNAVNEFWQENEDLEDWRPAVQMAAQEVQSQYPNASYEKVLQKAGEKVRKRLQAGEKAQEIEGNRKNQQAPAPSASGRPGPSGSSGQEQDVLDELGVD